MIVLDIVRVLLLLVSFGFLPKNQAHFGPFEPKVVSTETK